MEVIDIYCRVSTREQAEEGYSLGEQESKLRKYAEAHDWTVNKVYLDGGYSGASIDRPGLQSMIQDAKNKVISKVLVYKLDRLSRSQKDTLYIIEDVLIKNGIGFVSMSESLDTGTAFGMAMIGILSVFAQLERETIKERMMIGKDARAKSGLYRGGSRDPIGYHYNPATQCLEVDEDLAPVVRSIFEGYLNGDSEWKLSRMISSVLSNRSGSSTVHRMLRSKIYIGFQLWKDEWYKIDNFTPIISEELWQAVQNKIALQEAVDKPQSAHSSSAMLSGLVWCSKCGKRMYQTRKLVKGKKYSYYYCGQIIFKAKYGDECQCNNSIKAEVLEDAVIDELRKISISGITEKADNRFREKDDIRRQLKVLDAQQERLVSLYAIGSIPIEQIAYRSKQIQDQQSELYKKLDHINSLPQAISMREATESIKTFSDIVDMVSDHDELHDIAHKLIKSVSYGDDTVDITWAF